MRSQAPGGTSSGGMGRSVLRRPSAAPAACRASAGVSPSAQPPSGAGTATRASEGAESSAKPPSPHATCGPATCDLPPSMAALREAAARSRDPPGTCVPSSTARAASRIVCQPVQRHRWAASALVGSAPGERRVWLSSLRMMPGVQNPHWLAPVAQKASAQTSLRAGSNPASVVTRRPATRRAGVTQATRAAPSTSTVQAPHWPCGLQPSFTSEMPRCSRSSVSSEKSPAGALTGRPSTVRLMWSPAGAGTEVS